MTDAMTRLMRRILSARGAAFKGDSAKPGYDPELLYVECGRCGRPVLWEPGKSTELLRGAGIDAEKLDDHCLILSDGCAECTPGRHLFETRVVRLKNHANSAYWARSGVHGAA